MSKERPILFSGPMVRAIREGRKTQTRRPVTPQPPAGYDRVSEYVYSPTYSARWENDGPPGTLGMWTKRCPYGAPAGPWQTFRDRPPGGDGWYDVRWRPGDEPRTVYLRCVTVSDEPDLDRLDPTSWLWGKDERDDPEAISIDVADPWSIAWRVPGDRLWVRETFYVDDYRYPKERERIAEFREALHYRADHDCRDWEAGCPCNPDGDGKRSEWRPSIHMPRWASRLTLAIEAVRVERLQEISEDDARAEGVDWAAPQFLELELGDDDREDPREVGYPSASASFARDNFRRLWDALNGKSAPWASNPWVWVVTFRVL